MQVIYYFKNKINIVHVLAITFLTLTSCGTYQQATYDDGIYGSTQERVQTTEVATTGNDPYQNYFQQKSFEADDRYGDVFTDVDSYSSQDYVDPEVNVDDIGYTESYGAWGQTTENININVYTSNLWNRGFYGWNNWGYGLGWNNWGWNNWGWNNWGWGNNPWNYWGWNAGLCGSYGYAGFYGQTYFRNRANGYAYNGGRRIAYANRNAANSNRRGNYLARTSRRNNTAVRSTRNSRNSNSIRTTRNTRNNVRTTRSTRNTRNTRATRSTRNNNQVRPSTTRSSNTRSTRSSMSTRSSSSRGSSVRSSSSRSNRSSGSSSSSRGGSRRGGKR